MADPNFAAAVLRGIGAPVTPKNIAAMEGWAQAEGGASHHNPLNTTQGAPGATNFNSVGVKTYPNDNVGVQATLTTLKNGRYGGIINAFRANDPMGVARAIGASPWGTSGSLVSQTIAAALRSNPQVPAGGLGRAPTLTPPGTSSQQIANSIGGGINTKALAAAVLAREASRPIDTSGKVSAGGNFLGDYLSAQRSGQFNAPTQHVTSTIPGTPANGGSLRTEGHVALANNGDNVDPLGPAWNIGRTDMGVDANAAPGTPIHALNASRVVQVVPNWYAGQPLVLMKILSGPDAGKYWYVSEQITNVPHVGQDIPRGGVVAAYASHGTGIEIGWGDPNTNSRTAAGPHYTEGAVTPEGTNFLHHVLGR